MKKKLETNKYLSEFVYGSIDGTITTIAIIAGSLGLGLPIEFLIIIALASLFADGFSMGISSYLSTKTKNEINKKNKEKDDQENALKSGIITFFSFIIIGLIPILPYIFDFIKNKKLSKNTHVIAISFSISTLFLIGSIRNHILNKNMIKGGLNTLFIGFIGGFIAFFIGYYLNKLTEK